MDIYVGNLPYSATEEELGELFSSFGPVKRVTIIKDRETGRSKGFGFVVLEDESKVEGAIEEASDEESDAQNEIASAQSAGRKV